MTFTPFNTPVALAISVNDGEWHQAANWNIEWGKFPRNPWMILTLDNGWKELGFPDTMTPSDNSGIPALIRARHEDREMIIHGTVYLKSETRGVYPANLRSELLFGPEEQ